MIVCPQCKHQELPGTIFCSECGTQLVPVHHPVTMSISPEQVWSTPDVQVTPPVPQRGRTGRLAIHMLDTGILVPLEGSHEFTFGRLSEGQPVIPDVDLSAYNAYENGVSRLHAVVKRDAGNHALVMDLGSSNGTYVNGRRINPHVEEPLNHGDIIALGKLKIQVLLRNI